MSVPRSPPALAESKLLCTATVKELLLKIASQLKVLHVLVARDKRVNAPVVFLRTLVLERARLISHRQCKRTWVLDRVFKINKINRNVLRISVEACEVNLSRDWSRAFLHVFPGFNSTFQPQHALWVS